MKSINVSGHKYGLVYPGVGWIIWRDAEELPDELIFHVNYLGGDMPTFTLNFSRPGNQVIAQYYNFIRLGFEGYRRIMLSLQKTAMYEGFSMDMADALVNDFKKAIDFCSGKRKNQGMFSH